MKFTIDRVRFSKMLRLAQRRMPGQKRADPNVVISAYAGRVFLSANATVLGEEALVLRDGQCTVDVKLFAAIIATYQGVPNLTFEAEPGVLRFRTSQIAASGYDPTPQPPVHFQPIHMNDTWLASSTAPASRTGGRS